MDWSQINAQYAAGQPDRNADQLAIIKGELANTQDPNAAAGLLREMSRLQNNPMGQTTITGVSADNTMPQGNPFDSLDSAPVQTKAQVNPFDQFDGSHGNPFDSMDNSPGILGHIGAGLEAGASVMAGLPSQIVGGLRGLGTLASGQGLTAANQALQNTEQSNFGLGAYKPATALGQKYAQNVGEAMNKPVEWAGNIGEALGGNIGRTTGEVGAGTLMALLDPAALIGVGKGILSRGETPTINKPPAVTSLEANLDKIDATKAYTNPFDTLDNNNAPVGTQAEIPMPENQPVASPYDAGQAGVTEPITPQRSAAQMELPLTNELPSQINVDTNGVTIPPEQARAVEAAKGQYESSLDQSAAQIQSNDFLNAKQQEMFGNPDLFELGKSGEIAPKEPLPELSQQADWVGNREANRPFTDLRADDGQGGERPLTRGEFETTMDNLANAPSTQFERPKPGPETDAAYELYQNQVSGKQGDLFDIPSRQENFNNALYQDKIPTMVDNHPFVRNAETKLAKQQKFVDDLTAQVANGDTKTTALISEIKALKEAQAKVDAVRNNVTTALRNKQEPTFNVRTRKQGGGLLVSDLWKAKDKDRIAEPSSTNLKALTDDIARNGVKQPVTITYSTADHKGYVTDGNNRLAAAKRLGMSEVPYRVEKTDVPFTRDQLSKAKSADELGLKQSDLVDRPISKQAMDANEWLKQFNSGNNPPPFVPRGQRGGINLKEISEGLSKMKKDFDAGFKSIEHAKFDSEKAAADYISKNIPGAEAAGSLFKEPDRPEVSIQKILNSNVGDTPSIYKALASGLGLTAAKYKNNPLLMSVSRELSYAYKKGEYQAKQLVQPLQKFFSTMTKDEMIAHNALFRREAMNGVRYTPDELKAAGMSDKAVQAYTMQRAALDSARDIQNKALAKMGKEPIDAMDAYMASTWHGDWHAPILDKHGQLKWYIRTTSRSEGVKAIAYLKDKFGDTLKTDIKPEYRDSGNPNRPSDVMGAYHDMLDFFKDDEGVSKQIQEAMQDYMGQKGYQAIGQSKHFLEKKGVHGFEGDRPWLTPEKNAYAGAQAQLSYIKNATKWSALQEAIANSKEIMSNPDVVAKMPNALDYAKSVVAHQMGIDSNVIAPVESAIARLIGQSRSSLYRGVADIKSMTYLQTLGLSLPYMITTPLQAVMNAPVWHRILTNEGFTHNVAKTSIVALSDTMGGILRHMAHEMSMDVKVPMTAFGERALKYAEDAGVVNKNLFDESSGLGEHAVPAAIKSAAGWTIGFPEKVARMGTFMSIAQHLKDSGKFGSDEAALFRRAEEVSKNAITSLDPMDRPQIVSTLGSVGQGLYTFKSFLFNGFNQLHVATRMAKEFSETGGKSGAISPLLAAVGMYTLMGGLSNIPGVDEADMLWQTMKDASAAWAPKFYAEHLAGGPGLKGSIISMLPQTSGWRDLIAYGGPSVALHTSLNTRMNLGTGIDVEHPMAGIAPLAQEIKEWGSLGSIALHPNSDAALSGLYTNSPPLIKGLLETKLDAFKAGNNPENQGYYKPGDLTNPTLQSHRRNQEDTYIKSLGATSLNEARDKQAQYINNREQERIQTAQNALVEHIMSGIKRGDNQDIKNYSLAFLKLNPNDQSFNQALNQGIMKMNLTPEEARIMQMKTVQQIQNYMRYRTMAP